MRTGLPTVQCSSYKYQISDMLKYVMYVVGGYYRAHTILYEAWSNFPLYDYSIKHKQSCSIWVYDSVVYKVTKRRRKNKNNKLQK